MKANTQTFELQPDRFFGRALLSAHLVAPAGTLTAGEMFPVELSMHGYERERLESASLSIINRERSFDGDDVEIFHPITARSYVVTLSEKPAFRHSARLKVQTPPDAVSSFTNIDGGTRVETAFVLTVKRPDSKKPTSFTAVLPLRGVTEWGAPALTGKKIKTSNEHLELELDDGVCWPGGTLDGRVRVKPTKRAARATHLSLDLTADIDTGFGFNDKVRVSRVIDGPFPAALDYEFELKVPDDARPSYRGKHISVDWLLRACLDVPFAPDPTVGLRFRVVPTPR